MTLALHGKSRKRVQGLIFAAFMAVMMAALAGVSFIGTAFAHHLEGDVDLPTCENNQQWALDVWEGDWFDYREAVLTVTDPTTPVSMVFTPFVYDGSLAGDTTILTASGTGTVHTAGNIQIYEGTFGNDHDPDIGGIFGTDPITAGDTTLESDNDWPAGYVAGQVIRWDDELMLITVRSANGNVLTVTRGFGHTDAVAHTDQNFTDDVSRWIRGSAEGEAADNFAWDIDFDATDCDESSVEVVKTNSTDSNVDLGEDFWWVITVVVEDGPTTGPTQITDSIPSPFVVRVGGLWGLTDGTGNDASLTCPDQAGPDIACTIATGATPGTYIVEIPVEVPATESPTFCGAERTNTATIVGPDVTGTAIPGTPNSTDSDSDDVNINPCLFPSVSVVKSDDTGGIANLGETFNFFLDVTVSNGPTLADYGINDDVPNAFTVNSVTPEAPITCTASLDPVDCTLPAGATTDTYRIAINVTVNPGTSCNETYNNIARSDTQQELSSDTIEVDGCGSIKFDKSDGVLHGDHIDWTITLSNSSVLADTVTVIDSGTSLESETCTNDVSESPADTYECDVPGSGTNGGVATLVLSTPLPQDYDPVCDSILVENTAQDSDTQESDGGVYSDTAEPDETCLTVTKDAVGIVDGDPTWNINVVNAAGVSVPVFIRDAGAEFVMVVSGGTCPGVVANQSLDLGISCTVNANATLIVQVEKQPPAATCEGTDVPNTAEVWFGQHSVAPSTTPDHSAAGTTFEDVNADPGLCNQVIQVCKVWRPNAILNDPTNFAFDFSDSSEEVPAIQQHSIFGVAEGDADGECILLEVSPGLVNINEIVPPGFILEGYTLLEGDLVDDDLTPAALFGNNPEPWDVSFFVSDNGCFIPVLVGDLLDLVRDIAGLVVEVSPPQDIICTVTFFNRDDGVTLNDGALRIEKYLDVNGDGDSNDAALGEGLIDGWDMTTAGPDVNETTPTGDDAPVAHPDGALFYPGLISGDAYTVTEEMRAGWQVTNATIDGVSIGASTVANTTIPNGGTRVVRFYNQQLGDINVHKEAQTQHNGVTSAAPNDDDGWTITLDSEDCDIHFVGVTDANGNLTFSGLPMCDDYVVAEVGPNASSPGFVQVSPAGPFTNQAPEGQTLTFLNRRVTNDPPCLNCTQTTPTPTTTPTTTPTATPTTPTTPTATPTDPTAAPTTPVTQIAGEKTPGPGQTPIAPSAGNGLLGGSSAGLNLLLMLAGFIAISTGLGVLALGRKRIN